MALRRIAQVMKLGKWRNYVGRDLVDNRYFEAIRERGTLPRRYVEYKTRKEFLGEYRPEQLPIQWAAWLRHTRRDAPTIQELQADEIRRARLAENVARLKAAEEEERTRRRLDDAAAISRKREISPSSISEDSTPAPEETANAVFDSSQVDRDPSGFDADESLRTRIPPQSRPSPSPSSQLSASSPEARLEERKAEEMRRWVERQRGEQQQKGTGPSDSSSPQGFQRPHNPDDNYQPQSWNPTPAQRG